MPITFTKLSIPEVLLIEPTRIADSRGYFAELYKSTEFARFGVTKPIAQINTSRSQKNTLRGLHYQLNPSSQAKIINVYEGEIFDVAVDLRCGSPTLGKWAGRKLSADNLAAMYIPEGFAHGFCVLSENATVVYYCTHEYSLANERGLSWNDPQINIHWPIKNPTLSARDAKLPAFKDAEYNFSFI
jgi:dTDP-4-dehydrorhamnose 3,5-epimerase